MRIADLDPTDARLLESLAKLTHASAALHAPNWLPSLADAREELAGATRAGHVTRVLFDEGGAPAGWISAVHQYGAVWEIHPLLVGPDHHRRGFGAQLVADVEQTAASRGAAVSFVSTSDEVGSTSLGGVDLYEDPLGALANISIDPSHAMGFWLRQGYALVGMIPDAEGPGKPSIHLTKRLGDFSI